MSDIERVELTVRLRRVERRVGVRVLDQSGGDLLASPARSPFVEGEREAFTIDSFDLRPDSSRRDEVNTCSLDSLAQAFAEQETAVLQRVLSGHNQAHLGEFLTRGLFGGWEDQADLFRRVFHASREDRPSCLTGPVHLRIQAATGAEDLLVLPWRAMAWEGHPLRRAGTDWIFSVTTDQSPQRDVTLQRPCNVLLLLPDHGRPAGTNATLGPTGGADHATALTAKLCSLNEAFASEGRVQRVKFASNVEGKIAQTKPQVIYWYGHTRHEGDLVQLLFDDGPLSIKALADMIARLEVRPNLVYLNGCSTGVGSFLSGPRQLSRFVPAVVANQLRADTTISRQLAIPFFHGLFNDGALEPAAALERAADTPGIDRDNWPWLAPMVWGSYGRWTPSFKRRSALDIESLVLKLDRQKQRDAAAGRLKALLDERLGSARAISYVFFGSRTDHVEGFPGALREHLQAELQQKIFLVPVDGIASMAAPPAQHRAALRGLLAAALGVPTEGIKQELSRLSTRAPKRTVPLVWIDWGTYGSPGARELTEKELLRWQLALHHELSDILPEDMIGVSILGQEVPDAHAAYVSFRKAIRDEAYVTGRLHIEPLEALGPVDFTEFINLFKENAEALGIDEVDWARVARKMLADRDDVPYAEAVARLKEARAMGWRIFLLED